MSRGLTLDAVVFDVDGTLFDTEALSRGTWFEIGTKMNCLPVWERYEEFIGRPRPDIRDHLREIMGPDFPAEDFLLICSRRSQEKMEQNGVPMKPGVREILDFLAQRHIPMALATSTGGERTARRLELTGLGHYFREIVTGDQIHRGKPDPQIYQVACQRLGVDPARALAVEDSRNGILSATAAGLPTVMIPDLIPPDAELEEKIFRRFDSLAELRDFLAEELQ